MNVPPLNRSKPFSKFIAFLLLLLKEFLSSHALMPDCPLFQMHFQKIIGVRPQTEYLSERNRIHTDQLNTAHSTVSFDCYKICKKDADCIAYVHLLDTNQCYGYSLLQRTLHYLELGSRSFSLIEDPNAIFYEKICLKVPEDCNERRWVLTKIPGNSLMLEGTKTIPYLITRRECAEKCLFETDFKCFSASFAPSYRNNKERFNEQLHEHQSHNKALGRCVLSDKDKMLQPDTFRTAPFEEEYIENQCHQRAIESDHCSYELYGDSTFIEASTEAQYMGVTQKECQSLCSNTATFYCQGTSYFYNGDVTQAKCLLHSEDIISMGPRSLSAKKNSVYMRRVKCLDVQVVCTKDEMTVKYTPKDWFRGKIYTSWHSKDCWAKGQGNNSIALHLPIGSENKEKQCGILRAYEVNGSNQRTFIATFVVIQNNPNVQTQGDRLIKVGCILNGPVNLSAPNQNDNRDNKKDIPSAIALESSMESTKLFPPNYTTITTEFAPRITLQIIDSSHNRETKDVQIGQNLEFQIIAEYANGTGSKSSPPPNFRATSLIAKSEGTKDLILLIDEHGCPTDETIFPALERLKTRNRNTLRSNFQAFKFVGSPTVSFDVNIQFCVENCPNNNCLQSDSFYSVRSRRQLDQFKPLRVKNPVYFSTVTEEDISQRSLINKNTNQKLPLTYNLRVHGFDDKNIGSDLSADFGPYVLIRADDGNLTSYCLHQSLFIAIFIFVLILLAMIIFGCCFVIKKRQRFNRFNEEPS